MYNYLKPPFEPLDKVKADVALVIVREPASFELMVAVPERPKVSVFPVVESVAKLLAVSIESAALVFPSYIFEPSISRGLLLIYILDPDNV